MSSPHSFFHCTSADFEKAAIDRFRSLVGFLPENCQIFRETWECSTVLCLNFVHCPTELTIVQEQSEILVDVVQALGLGNAIIFKLDRKLMGSTVISP